MESVHHYIPNGAGWLLSLHQTWQPGKVDSSRRPVLIVPGYGMNSFIFSYHPNGSSLEGWLADAGFEVWRVDLRAQGGAISTGGSRDFSLEDLALVDLEVAIRAVVERTRTSRKKVDIIGASLGGTLMFVHAALGSSEHIGARVSMGSPLRWVQIHPAIRLAFRSPTLIGLLPLRGTRPLARLALPVLARYTPWLLSVYMNPEITDTGAAEEMVKTVEDPNRHINRQIARWIRQRDLLIEGVNISKAVSRLSTPLMTVVAHSDGVVPAETAAFPHHHIRAPRRQLLVVGDDTLAMAHADLFVSREAQERVFRPLSDWLAENPAPLKAEDGPGGSGKDKGEPQNPASPLTSGKAEDLKSSEGQKRAEAPKSTELLKKAEALKSAESPKKTAAPKKAASAKKSAAAKEAPAPKKTPAEKKAATPKKSAAPKKTATPQKATAPAKSAGQKKTAAPIQTKSQQKTPPSQKAETQKKTETQKNAPSSSSASAKPTASEPKA